MLSRRGFLALTGGAWIASSGMMPRQHGDPARGSLPAVAPITGDADITLRIREIEHELMPRRTIKTLAYNGQVPGPVLRAKRGVPLTVDVWNDAKDEDIVHWHGMHVPSAVDGSYEEGTPGVPPRSRRRYAFAPTPAGTRWYHSHNPSGRGFKGGTYSGQFGMFVVEDGDPGAYDAEVPILLHEWDPRLADQGPPDVEYRYFTINGKMLGAGEPLRVRRGQRVLFRIVNASATMTHRLGLPGHQFLVTALDGNPVPNPQRVSLLELAPGERVDALVDMAEPGVWILGEIDIRQRTAGMGTVVEYAGQSGSPRGDPVQGSGWRYARFGGQTPVPEPDERLTIVLRPEDDGHRWTINGKAHPKTDPILVRANKRYRWLIDNQSGLAHPMHLHRHTFEIVRVADERMSGIWKDVVVVPPWQQAEIDVPTTEPGPTLFHCHQQFHMDMGMMTLMRYTE